MMRRGPIICNMRVGLTTEVCDSCGQLGNSELLNIEVLDSRIKNSTIADRLHVGDVGCYH